MSDAHTPGGKRSASTTAASTTAANVPPAAPPAPLLELADACVGFVKKALGVELDRTLETLPLLDHYLTQHAALADVRDRAEIQSLVATSAGAYFGEVARLRHPSFWIEGEVPEDHRLCFIERWLVIYPVRMMREALEAATPVAKPDAAPGATPEANADPSGIELLPEDRAIVEPRLAELPPVSAEEFLAPSTRLEVIDIAVDALRARDAAEGRPPLALGPADYVD